MTAHKLCLKIARICEENNVRPEDVKVNFRWDSNSDVFRIKKVEEDLFDSKTNNILTSIVLRP